MLDTTAPDLSPTLRYEADSYLNESSHTLGIITMKLFFEATGFIFNGWTILSSDTNKAEINYSLPGPISIGGAKTSLSDWFSQSEEEFVDGEEEDAELTPEEEADYAAEAALEDKSFILEDLQDTFNLSDGTTDLLENLISTGITLAHTQAFLHYDKH